MTIRIALGGATGWAGSALANAINAQPDMSLVAAVSRKRAGCQLRAVIPHFSGDVTISGSVSDALRHPADVYFDYTHPDVVKDNVMNAIESGVSVVIGTSGLSEQDYADIDRAAQKKGVGIAAVGNFSITAVLLERFAAEAARYIDDWEIIDYASSMKIDSPSGTARQLASRLAEVRRERTDPLRLTPHEADGGRGAVVANSRIHSVRLPGYVIAIEIVFGSENQRLQIRHDATADPTPYTAGALFAIRKVRKHRGLVRGLDNLLG